MKLFLIPLVLVLAACGMDPNAGVGIGPSGGAIAIDTTPPTPQELEQLVLAIEELGFDNVQLIEDDQTRALYRLTCVMMGGRITVRDMPGTIAEFCGPVIEALD